LFSWRFALSLFKAKLMTRQERILRRNEELRKKFAQMAKKKCYRVDYMLEQLSIETGFHPEYIRSIIKENNTTERRIRQNGIQLSFID